MLAAVGNLLHAKHVPKLHQGDFGWVADTDPVYIGGVACQNRRLKKHPLGIVCKVERFAVHQNPVGVNLLHLHFVLRQSARLIRADY